MSSNQNIIQGIQNLLQDVIPTAKIITNTVQNQVEKYKNWIIVLYVLVGITTVFSVLTFISVLRRCKRT